ncbi:MAG: ATP synthase F0 subunit B [Deltaproteobacteria bacterium]|nr:ATP synthase F0 subunit B [Deltaproteobacteria bacterium]
MEIVSNIALISINETLIIQLISFLIFLFIIKRIMFRPLQQTMGDRSRFIEGIKQDIAAAEKELTVVTQDAKTRESALIKEAHQAKKDVEDIAAREAEDILTSARAEAIDIARQAEAEVNTMIKTATDHLEHEAEVVTVAIMEKVLKRRLAS